MSQSVIVNRHAIYGISTAIVLGLSSGCFSPGSAEADGAETYVEAAPPRCITSEESDTLADQVLQLVNLERAAADDDLAPVVVNSNLTKIAGSYACRMVELSFFGHTDPETGHGPGERAVAGKYSYFSVGENLASGAATAAEAVQLWMDSPPHRAIILDQKWKDVGIGVRTGSDNSIIWVQEFGDPAQY